MVTYFRFDPSPWGAVSCFNGLWRSSMVITSCLYHHNPSVPGLPSKSYWSSGATLMACRADFALQRRPSVEEKHIHAGWWFGTFFIFPYTGNNHPNWLIFFRGVAQPPTRNHPQVITIKRWDTTSPNGSWFIVGWPTGKNRTEVAAFFRECGWSVVRFGSVWEATKRWAVFKSPVGWWLVRGLYYPSYIGDYSHSNRGIPINQPGLNGMREGFWTLLGLSMYLRISLWISEKATWWFLKVPLVIIHL